VVVCCCENEPWDADAGPVPEANAEADLAVELKFCGVGGSCCICREWKDDDERKKRLQPSAGRRVGPSPCATT